MVTKPTKQQEWLGDDDESIKGETESKQDQLGHEMDE
jgi:hypothetical protein